MLFATLAPDYQIQTCYCFQSRNLEMVGFNGREERRGRFTGTFPGAEVRDSRCSTVWSTMKSHTASHRTNDSSVKLHAMFKVG